MSKYFFMSIPVICIMTVMLVFDARATGGDYTSEVLYTIPWGEDPWEISDHWMIGYVSSTAGEETMWIDSTWVVREDDELIIVDGHDTPGLKKFDCNGSLVEFVTPQLSDSYG